MPINACEQTNLIQSEKLYTTATEHKKGRLWRELQETSKGHKRRQSEVKTSTLLGLFSEDF